MLILVIKLDKLMLIKKLPKIMKIVIIFSLIFFP